MTDDALLTAEIGRRCRQRFVAVYLCAAMAALMCVGVFYSARMMHGPGFQAADGTIVAVARDPESGELEMTSEFTDAEGVTHRDRQSEGYHYAPGEPKVGQSIEYFYKRSEYTGDLYFVPRADRILQWIFGVPLAIFVLLGGLVGWFALRQRSFRRRLLREGRRDPGQMHAIVQRSITIPVGAAANQPIQTWRLEARYFEATRGEFVDCNSDWLPMPAPELTAESPLPPILVDPNDPKRYWLPVGALAAPTQRGS